MKLYLVRHGQSEGNLLKNFHGQIDYPLTPEGRRQAGRSAEKLRGITFARCLSSDLQRAWKTALICLEGRDMQPEKCPALREQFIGEMEGVTWQEAETRLPEVKRAYVQDWFHTTPPGGESPEEMEARVAGCVDEVIRRGEDTLLVAHNGSLSLVLKHLGIAGEKELLKPGWFFGQGDYTVIEVADAKAEMLGFNL